MSSYFGSAGTLQGTGMVHLYNDQKIVERPLSDIEKHAKIVEYLKGIPSEIKVSHAAQVYLNQL